MHLISVKPVLKRGVRHALDSFIYDTKKGSKKTSDPIHAKNIATNEIDEVKPTVISKPMYTSIAAQFKNDFQSKHKNLEIKILSDDKQTPKTVRLSVKGSMFDLRATKKYGHFPKDNFSKTESVKEQLNFPFPKLKKLEKGFIVDGQLSLKEVLKLPIISFDDEFRFWQEKIFLEDLRVSDKQIKNFLEENNIKYENSSNHKNLVKIVEDYFNKEIKDPTSIHFQQPSTLQVGFIRPNNTYEVHFFEHVMGENNKEVINTNLGDVDVYNHKSDDALLMLEKRNEVLKKIKPAIMISHNGMTYDLSEEKKFILESKKRGFSKQKEHFFLNSKPVSRPTGFIKKVTLDSITHIDMYPFAQHYLPFSENNKLVTVASLLLNRKITKRISYDHQTQVDFEVMMGGDDIEAKKYGVEDILYYLESKDWIVKTHYHLAKMYGRIFEDVGNTSKRNIAMDRFIADNLKSDPRFVPMNIVENNTYQDFDAPKEFFKNIDKKLNINTQINQGTLCYLTPWSRILLNRLKNKSSVMDSFNAIKECNILPNETSTQNTLFRFVLMYAIEEGLLYPEIYYLHKNNFPNFKDQISSLQEKYNSFFNKFNPLNKKNNFVIFPKELSESKEFNEQFKGLGFKIAKGNTFNPGRGRFAMYDGVNMFKMGMDISGKRGFKNLYHEELITNAIEFSIKENDINKARDYISNFYHQMSNKEIRPERLVYYRKKIARDYYMYSSIAQKTAFVQASIDKNLREGDEFAYISTPNGWIKLESLDEITQDIYEHNISIDLGPFGKKGERKFSEGKVSKILKPLINKNLNYDMETLF